MGSMSVTTVSSKFQIVIPKDVRDRLRIQPGQKFQAIPYRGRIELIPVEPAGATRGMAAGIDTEVPREADRE